MCFFLRIVLCQNRYYNKIFVYNIFENIFFATYLSFLLSFQRLSFMLMQFFLSWHRVYRVIGGLHDR